jgi:hypothetical protein
MARGFKTGGRKRGSRNKKTLLLEREGRDVIEKALGQNAFDGDAHALLVLVYKNLELPLELRMDAAKAAIRFEKAVLAAVEHSGQLTKSLREMTDEELLVIAGGGNGVTENA